MAKKLNSIAATDDISPLLKGLVEHLAGSELKKHSVSRSVQKTIGLAFADPLEEPKTNEPPSLVKSIVNILDGGPGAKNSIERLAFEADPSQTNQYSSLYKGKMRLIPDSVLKRISIQDDLVAAIVNARSNHLSAFGRPRQDRFNLGFVIEPKPGVLDRCSQEQKKDLQDRIDQVTQKLVTCGETKGWDDNDKMTFAQYLFMSTRDAMTVGRIATEVIYVQGLDGQRRPHSFRPIDAGTIYRAAPQKSAAQSVRETARALIEQVKNKRLLPEKFEQDEYAWIQVIDTKPVQAFTNRECLVHNFYPVTHVELDGYPLTPLDTVIAAVTTHINITTHNKLYFQTGRAARGMLIIKSDDMDEGVVARIRQQFNASINSVANAWRMPVFGVGADDEITWAPIDSQGQRDAEFQYLADSNARVIMSAYQMSPEELPGYAHLSRGTNSQALSESNNEYKLQAARDVGIKPLIKQWEDFLNSCIMPILDANLAKVVRIQLQGLEADTAEKESIRLQQDMPVHMTYDEVLEKVEKDPVGKEWGGEFPINPQYQQILDNHSGLTVGEIAAHFFGRPDLKDRPDLQYVRDPMWFQWQSLMLQQQQMQMQMQQVQQPQPQQGEDGQPQSETRESDLTRSLDQAIGLLTKSERQLPASKRKLLAQHKATLDHFMKGWEKDIADLTSEIVKVARAGAKRG